MNEEVKLSVAIDNAIAEYVKENPKVYATIVDANEAYSNDEAFKETIEKMASAYVSIYNAKDILEEILSTGRNVTVVIDELVKFLKPFSSEK